MSDKKHFTILFVLIAVFVLWKFDIFGLSSHNTISVRPVEQQTKLEPGAFKHSTLGFTATYSANLFTATELADGVTFVSPYYVVDNQSGDPKNDRKHPFSVTIQIQNTDTLSYIKSLPYGSNFMTMFPKGTVASFTGDNGFAEKVMVHGKEAHKFTVGVEGANVDYYFISLGQNKTGVVTVSYFTDFLKDAVKPKAFSEASEKTAVATILNSLNF